VRSDRLYDYVITHHYDAVARVTQSSLMAIKSAINATGIVKHHLKFNFTHDRSSFLRRGPSSSAETLPLLS